MPKLETGKIWPSELSVTQDPISGATIRQYTHYMGHSNHAYFTYPCWHDGGRKLVIVSDRGNRVNLYSVDLETGSMTQLTDWDPSKNPKPISLRLSPVGEQACFIYDDHIMRLDLATLETQRLAPRPEGAYVDLGGVTADGKFVIAGFIEDLSHRINTDFLNGYVGFVETWQAKPHSSIWKIPLAGGEPIRVFEDQCWLGHFNTSPTRPDAVTFCQEGPWDRVDHRIWGLDLATNQTWKIRPTTQGESVGHEYWMADGQRVGYHGFGAVANEGFFGSINFDNSDPLEVPFHGSSQHFHSQSSDLIVGDMNAQKPYLFIWRLREGRFEGPKVLAIHRGSFHTQRLHVHPCVHDQSRKVLYTADPQGYGQIYIAEIPEFESLPDETAIS